MGNVIHFVRGISYSQATVCKRDVTPAMRVTDDKAQFLASGQCCAKCCVVLDKEIVAARRAPRKAEIIKTLEAYTGKHILPHAVETVRDPSGNAYAVRWQRTKKLAVEFLWYPSTKESSSLDSLEETEFTQWPPRSKRTASAHGVGQ